MKTFSVSAVLITLLALVLSACSAIPGLSGASAGNEASGGSTPGAGFTGQSGQAPTISGMALAAGMLKLDGTPYGVTPQEAAKLLPLWQSLQKTESSLPTPQAERTPQVGTQGTPGPRFDPQIAQALSSQVAAIESEMPAEQLQAIESMNLNRQDIFTIFQQAGITLGGFGQGGNGFRQGGGTFTPPQGTPDAPGTPRAFGEGTRRGFGGFVPPTVVEGIVKYLQKKAGS